MVLDIRFSLAAVATTIMLAALALTRATDFVRDAIREWLMVFIALVTALWNAWHGQFDNLEAPVVRRLRDDEPGRSHHR